MPTFVTLTRFYSEEDPSEELLYSLSRALQSEFTKLFQQKQAESFRPLHYQIKLKTTDIGLNKSSLVMSAVIGIKNIEDVELGEAWVSYDWDCVASHIERLSSFTLGFYEGVPYWTRNA